MKKLVSFLWMVIANIGALLLVPTASIAFLFGLLAVLHTRAFVHGWNIARGATAMDKSEVAALIRKAKANQAKKDQIGKVPF